MRDRNSRYDCAPSGAAIKSVVKLAALAVAAIGLLSAAIARAEDYKELPTENRGWAKILRLQASSSVKLMLHGDTPLDLDPFDKFFKEAMFPQFTLYKEPGSNVIVLDPKDAEFQKSRLPKMREDFKQFLAQGREEVPFDHLEDLAVDAMSEIALHNYHPLARYNAVLVLQSLHEFGVPEKPYPKTWKVFVDCLDSIGPVKVAGMNAILKNIKAGIPSDQQPRMIEKLEKILADKTVPAGESPEGHDWVRRKAMDVMLALGDPAINGKVVNDLAAILNNPQSPVELSCGAARMVGGIRSSALGTLDLPQLAGNIGRAAITATKAELARAEDRAFAAPLPVQNPSERGFGGRRTGPGGPAVDGAAPDAAAAPPSQQFIAVELLKGQLAALASAFNGPGGGLAGASNGNASVASVKEALDALIASCDSKAADYPTLKAQIERAAGGLENKLGKAAPSAAGGGAKAGSGDAFNSLDKTAPTPKTGPAPAGK